MSTYDDYKLATPDDDNRCPYCSADPREFRAGWKPDCCTGKCGVKWRDPDDEYEAMRDRQMERTNEPRPARHS